MRTRPLHLVLATLLTSGVLMGTYAPSSAANGGGGVFVPVTPAKIADSATLGKATPTSTKSFQVTNVAGVPASGVSAVVIDVAARSTTGVTSVHVKTAGTPAQAAILSAGGDTAWNSNTAIVKPSGTGHVTIETSSQAVDFTVDIQGYFTATSNGDSTGGYTSLHAPQRLVATNVGLGAPKAKLVAGTTYEYQLAGDETAPASSAAIFANVRVLNATSAGGLRIGAAGTPLTQGPSALNYTSGEPNDSGMAIKVSSTGKIAVNLSAGSADIIIDVQGFFTAGKEGGGYNPLNNTNVFDTRTTDPMAPGETRVVTVAGKGGVPTMGAAQAAQSVVLTIGAFNGTASGGVAVFNPETGSNGTSNVAFNAPYDGQAEMSTAVVRLSASGQVAIKNSTAGTVDIRLSVQGWFNEVSDIVGW